MKHNNTYPKVIYGYAILLDNKIENWAVRTINRRYLWEFKGCWKMGRLQDYKMCEECYDKYLDSDEKITINEFLKKKK